MLDDLPKTVPKKHEKKFGTVSPIYSNFKDAFSTAIGLADPLSLLVLFVLIRRSLL
jgi:hypothetical protein